MSGFDYYTDPFATQVGNHMGANMPRVVEVPAGTRYPDEESEKYRKRAEEMAGRMGKLVDFSKDDSDSDDEEWENHIIDTLGNINNSSSRSDSDDRYEQSVDAALERTIASAQSVADIIIRSPDINSAYDNHRRKLLLQYEEMLQHNLSEMPPNYADSTNLPLREREARRQLRIAFHRGNRDRVIAQAGELIDKYLHNDTLVLRCGKMVRMGYESAEAHTTRIRMSIQQSVIQTIKGYSSFRTETFEAATERSTTPEEGGDPVLSSAGIPVPISGEIRSPGREQPISNTKCPKISEIMNERHSKLLQRQKQIIATMDPYEDQETNAKNEAKTDWVGGYLLSNNCDNSDVNRLHHWMGIAKNLIAGTPAAVPSTAPEAPEPSIYTAESSVVHPVDLPILTRIAQRWIDETGYMSKTAGALVDDFTQEFPLRPYHIPQATTGRAQESLWRDRIILEVENLGKEICSNFEKWLQKQITTIPHHDGLEAMPVLLPGQSNIPWECQFDEINKNKNTRTELRQISPKRTERRPEPPEQLISPKRKRVGVPQPRIEQIKYSVDDVWDPGLHPFRRALRPVGGGQVFEDFSFDGQLSPLSPERLRSPSPFYKISSDPQSYLDKVLRTAITVVPALHLLVEVQKNIKKSEQEASILRSPRHVNRLLCDQCGHDAVFMCLDCNGSGFCPNCWTLIHSSDEARHHRRLTAPYVCFLCSSAASVECRKCKIKTCKNCWDAAHTGMDEKEHQKQTLDQGNYLVKSEPVQLSPQRNRVGSDVTNIWLAKNPNAVKRLNRANSTRPTSNNSAAIVPTVSRRIHSQESKFIPLPEHVQRLLTIYKSSNPSSIPKIFEVLRAHQGKEEELFKALENRTTVAASSKADPPKTD